MVKLVIWPKFYCEVVEAIKTLSSSWEPQKLNNVKATTSGIKLALISLKENLKLLYRSLSHELLLRGGQH